MYRPHDSSGAPSALADTLPRTDAARALSEQRDVIRTLDAIKAFAEFSPEGVLLRANERYLDIFGCTAGQVEGRQHREFCDPAYAESPAYAAFWARLHDGQAYTDLCERRRSDGRTCWLEATYAPIVEGGRVVRILKMASDVTDRVLRERDTLEATRRLSLVADATDNATLITDGDWGIVYVNRGFTAMFGWALADVAGKLPPRLLAPELPRSEVAALLHGLRAGKPIRREELLRGAHGERYWCSVSTNPVFDEQGVLINVVSVITDITQSKMHQVLQHRVLEAVASDRALVEVAEMICREVDAMLPAAATCVMQVNAEGLLMPLAAPRLPAAYREYMARNAGHFNGVPGFGDNDGEPASPNGVLCTDIATDPRWPVFRDELLAAGYSAFWAMPVVGQKGRVIGAVVIHFGERRGPDDFHRRLMEACIQLCSLSLERERAKQRIHRLAFYDVLTRLPNRSLLQAKAEQALASSAREDEQAAVLFIDLDRFKLVNDSLGHPAGDELLRKVAGRMLEGRRLADIVSRISGDEFVIVLPACDAEDAAEIVSRLQHSLHAPLRIGNAEVCPSTSIGVAMFPSDGRDMETLIHRADMAMYQTKRDGRGGYRFFDSEMNVQTQQRLSLEADLRAAIANRTLHLHYQPQVQLDTGALHGVEALARWSHPTRGNIPPVEFIPLAEDSDLMGPLTDWVLDEACAQLESWRADGLTVPNVSVNFSPTAFHNAALAAQVGERLQRHGLEPSDLTIEITESVMIDRHPGTMRVITELRALGVQLSMDDFGTGYSSLSYLHSLPVTELKLDRSFVSDLGRRDSARALSQAVVQIGLTLGLTVVAEGVETEDQRRLLEGLGCHVAQGYLLARPLAGDAFLAWMRARAG